MTRPWLEWPDWSGETVVIVATGPTASQVPLASGRSRARFLAVKDAWRLCPWAELLYGCDHHWWATHGGVPDFAGLRATFAKATIDQFGKRYPFLKVDIDSAHTRMRFDKIGQVGWGGNSGYHAINLAVQLGSKAIILVGFDFRVDLGLHFFGPHSYGNQRPNQKSTEAWREALDREAATLRQRGVKVINCSPVSTLKNFLKMGFEEALDACREVSPGFRLEACSGRDDRLQGGDDKTCHHGMRCGGCSEGPGRDRQGGAPEEVQIVGSDIIVGFG